MTAIDCLRTRALKPRDRTESLRCKDDAVLFTAVCLFASEEEQFDPDPVVPFDVGPELLVVRPSSLNCLLRSISWNVGLCKVEKFILLLMLAGPIFNVIFLH